MIQIDRNVTLSQLNELAIEVMSYLVKVDPFVLWLQAQVGTGKTTFTSSLLKALGLASHIPVQSPTYTIANEYCIDDQYYVHMDFYRVKGATSIDELGVLDCREYRGYLIEWPDAIGSDCGLPPTHILEISSLDENIRNFRLYSALS